MILVMGATGMIGSLVVKGLCAKGVPVRAATRNPSKAAPLRYLGASLVRVDWDQPSTLDRAMAGADKVLLIVPDSARTVDLQRAAVDAARRVSVPHLVKVSALGADPTSPTQIFAGHGKVERYIEELGLPFTHLRPHYIMQNLLVYAPYASRTGMFFAPMGDGAISLVDVRDVADVAVTALTARGHEGRVHEITGPEALTFHDAAAKLGAAASRELRYESVPAAVSTERLVRIGVSAWHSQAIAEFYEDYSRGTMAYVTDSVPTLAGKPARTFDGFAAEFASVFV